MPSVLHIFLYHNDLRKNIDIPRFIVADKQTRRLIEVTVKTFETTRKSGDSSSNSSKSITRKQSQSIHTKPFLACIPEKIIIHKSPIEYILKGIGDKYTIHFIGAQKSACRIIRHKTISEIATELKESGNIMADFGVDIALSMILKEFEHREAVQENTDIDLTGFFIDDGGQLIASGIDNIDILPSKEEVLDALNAIKELRRYYENRLDLLATTITWGMIAPFSFVLKLLRLPYLKWPALWGVSRSLKTTSGLIALALDGHHHNDSGFIRAQGSIDSVPRLGELISKTTFPYLVNEVNLVDERMRHVIEYMKTAIDSVIVRDKFSNSKSKSTIPIPGLSPLYLTSNFPMPIYNSAFMGRIIDRLHPKSESHISNDATAKEFDLILRGILGRLWPLGQFRNHFVMSNPAFLLDDSNRSKIINPLDLGLELVSKAYEYVSITRPEWFEKRLSENQLQESIIDSEVMVKRAFEALVNDYWNKSIPYLRAEEVDVNSRPIPLKLPTEVADRIAKLVDGNLIPDVKRDKDGHFIIYSGILNDLVKNGITKDQLPNLKALADYIPNSKYIRVHPGNKVVRCTGTDLGNYFDKTAKVEDE